MVMANDSPEIILPSLYPLQRSAFFGPERIIVCEASTKAGKSVGALAWIIHEGVAVVPGTSLLWVSPIYRQAEVMYKRMKRYLRKSGIPDTEWSCSDSKLTLTLPGGSTVYFKGADNTDSIYGSDYTRAVIDEASRCKTETRDAVLSTLTATRGLLRCIGNVKGRGNWFYQMAQLAKTSENMRYVKITAYDAVDAGVLDRSYIEEQRKTLPEMVFKELFLAEPAGDGGNPFGYDAIERCIRPLSSRKPVCFGVDVARSVDFTVVIGLDDERQVCVFDRWQGVPWPETKARIARLCGPNPTLVDSTGVGDAVLADLQRLDTGCYQGFQFTQKSKAQLIEDLIVSVQSGVIGFPDGVVRTEMETMEYEYSSTGVRYAAPDPLHDDCVMSIALANRHFPFSAPVSVSFVDMQPERVQASEQDWASDDYNWQTVGGGDIGRRYL